MQGGQSFDITLSLQETIFSRVFQLELESFAFHNHKKWCLVLIKTDRAMVRILYLILLYLSRRICISFWDLNTDLYIYN